MQRLSGRYSLKSAPVQQLDYQIEPQHWHSFEGFKLPKRGPFTQVICKHGAACLYVSQPGEVPLYYSTTPGWIHWHEQKLALPGRPQRINQGEVVIWTPYNHYQTLIDDLPLPPIAQPQPIPVAISQYRERIITAVQSRLGGRQRVAVAQSGGIDSLLVTYALRSLGVDVVALTVCSGPNDLDIISAKGATDAMGCPCLPIVVQPDQIHPLLDEAIACLEDTESSNVRMAIGNILMARHCQKLGLDLIFTGHGHDDVHGKGTLVKGVVAQQVGTESERWRDARYLGTTATSGMLKMFASTFRRYGIAVRMPYYDADLLEWAFSQPVEVIPMDYKKGFAHQVAHAVLPAGPWLDKKYSLGYLTGSGLSLKSNLLKPHKTLFETRSLYARLKKFSKQDLSDRIRWASSETYPGEPQCVP